MIFPLMTLVFGPFLPLVFFSLHVESVRVNLIWDPIYSFGWMFVNRGTGSSGYENPMGLVALLLGLLVLSIVVVIGYEIGKSRIRPMVKWVLFLIIVGSLSVTIREDDAANIQHLHFCILEMS